MALPLEAGESCVPRVNPRQRPPDRQPSLQYRWALIQKLGEPQARMREENIERTGKKGRQPRGNEGKVDRSGGQFSQSAGG